MFKKRIVPIVIVKDGIVVQSIQFKKYLPVGKPEVVIENLDRWGADEIIMIDITAARKKNGRPNFELIKKIGSMGLGTPLTYGGGIKSPLEVKEIIQLGFERIALTHSFFFENKIHSLLEAISNIAGAQAIVLGLPVKLIKNKIYQYDYNTQFISQINFVNLQKKEKFFSELLIMDVDGDGIDNGFNDNIYNFFKKKINKNIVLFGGLNKNIKVLKYLKKKNIVGVAIGNFLHYKEHALQEIKQFLVKKKFKMIRNQEYEKNII